MSLFAGVLPLRPGLSLLSPGEPDTVWADAHGVAWQSAGALGWIGGWTQDAPRLLIGGLPPGSIERTGDALTWRADAGDAALRVRADGQVDRLSWPRPHGQTGASPAWLAAPGAFCARLLAWPGGEAERDAFAATAPEASLEGRCLPWPCGGGHSFLHENTLCARPRGGPTRVLGELPAAPSYARSGPRGAALVLVDGVSLGAAREAPLIVLPDGLDLSEARICPRGERLLCLMDESLVEISLKDGAITTWAREGHRPAGWDDGGPLSWEPATGALGRPGGRSLALGFGAIPSTLWGDRLCGPGGFVWALDTGAPILALVGVGGGMPLDAVTASAALNDGVMLIVNDRLRRLDAGFTLGPPLSLPRAAGAPLALAAADDGVHVLCDRATLRVQADGRVDADGDPEVLATALEPRNGHAALPETAHRGAVDVWWTASGMAVRAEGACTDAERATLAALFEAPTAAALPLTPP